MQREGEALGGKNADAERELRVAESDRGAAEIAGVDCVE